MAKASRINGTGKLSATQQSVNAAVKAICDIMRRSNCAGALQYVSELTWILFLRILDERETREREEAEAVGAEFQPSLEAPAGTLRSASPTWCSTTSTSRTSGMATR
jgi:type I restriction enzyme M protein